MSEKIKVKDAIDKIIQFIESQGLSNVYNDLFILQMVDTIVSAHCSSEVYQSFYDWFSKLKKEFGERGVC
jgi:hypothetical protein